MHSHSSKEQVLSEGETDPLLTVVTDERNEVRARLPSQLVHATTAAPHLSSAATTKKRRVQQGVDD